MATARMTVDVVMQVAVGGLLMGLIYALVAAGLSLIFGLMDVVNFAHGELLMLAMFATFVIWQATGLDPLLLLPVVALLLFGVGVAIYRGLIARALSVQFNRGMVQIFVTFGLAIFIRGAAQFVFGGEFQQHHRHVALGNRTLDVAGVYPAAAAGRGGAGLPAGVRAACCWSRAPSSAGRWRRRARIATRWR